MNSYYSTLLTQLHILYTLVRQLLIMEDLRLVIYIYNNIIRGVFSLLYIVIAVDQRT